MKEKKLSGWNLILYASKLLSLIIFFVFFTILFLVFVYVLSSRRNYIVCILLFRREQWNFCFIFFFFLFLFLGIFQIYNIIQIIHLRLLFSELWSAAGCMESIYYSIRNMGRGNPRTSCCVWEKTVCHSDRNGDQFQISEFFRSN